MKNTCIAAIGALAVNGIACAQSSVTAYGLIDLSVNHVRFSRTPAQPSAGITTLTSDASRLGFRGIEDLGQGRRAYFKLETGFNADTGAQTNPNQFWNRESYVGLGDNRLGSIQLGSQYTPFVWNSGKVDPFGRFGIGSITNLLQGSPRGWAVTYNNAIQYVSPQVGGFVGRLMVALGEGAATGSSYAASVEYAKGPVYATLNYDRIGTTAASVGLAGATVHTHTVAAGGTYDFGAFKLAAWLQTNRGDRLASVNGYMVGATVPIGAGEIRASYAHRQQTNADAKLAALGYYHFLSKRTALYGQVGRLKNSGTAAFGLGPARTEHAATGLLAAGRDATGIQLGMRHTF